MNYLAHLYLSGNSSKLRIGNFIADAVKGRSYQRYEEDIAAGIIMHRFIDSFTDQHEIVNKSKERLRKNYGKYAGVITDIFYDHFLATNWENYSDEPLEQYVSAAYKLMFAHFHILPTRVQYMLPFMTFRNWLFNYKFIKGVERTLYGLTIRRVRSDARLHHSIEELAHFYEDFETEFNCFFPEIIQYAAQIREDHSKSSLLNAPTGANAAPSLLSSDFRG